MRQMSIRNRNRINASAGATCTMTSASAISPSSSPDALATVWPRVGPCRPPVHPALCRCRTLIPALQVAKLPAGRTEWRPCWPGITVSTSGPMPCSVNSVAVIRSTIRGLIRKAGRIIRRRTCVKFQVASTNVGTSVTSSAGGFLTHSNTIIQHRIPVIISSIAVSKSKRLSILFIPFLFAYLP